MCYDNDEVQDLRSEVTTLRRWVEEMQEELARLRGDSYYETRYRPATAEDLPARPTLYRAEANPVGVVVYRESDFEFRREGTVFQISSWRNPVVVPVEEFDFTGLFVKYNVEIQRESVWVPRESNRCGSHGNRRILQDPRQAGSTSLVNHDPRAKESPMNHNIPAPENWTRCPETAAVTNGTRKVSWCDASARFRVDVPGSVPIYVACPNLAVKLAMVAR